LETRQYLRGASLRIACTAMALGPFIAAANAQVVIPHGDFDNDAEKYIVAIISLTLLGVAVWRYHKSIR